MPVSLPPTNKVLPPTKANAFLRSQKICVSVQSGLPQTIARMCVWSLRESIGFLFTISWSRPATSSLLTQNTSKRSRVKRQTKRMQNGSRISLSTILFRGALSDLSLAAKRENHGGRPLCESHALLEILVHDCLVVCRHRYIVYRLRLSLNEVKIEAVHEERCYRRC